MLHQVSDLFELYVKLRCQKVNYYYSSIRLQRLQKAIKM